MKRTVALSIAIIISCLVTSNALATTPPTASFTINMNELNVQFVNGSANADSGFYDFGDGTTSAAPNPVHQYPAAGIYTACLYAFNDCGVDTFCMEIEVTCTLPTASFIHVALGLQVGFSNNSSDYDAVFYDFGAVSSTHLRAHET